MKPETDIQYEYLQLDRAKKDLAQTLFNHFEKSITTKFHREELQHFCFQVAIIIPNSKKLMELFIDDLCTAIEDILHSKTSGRSRAEKRSVLEESRVHLDELRTTKRVLLALKRSGFIPKKETNKITGVIQAHIERANKYLSTMAKRGPSADIHETAGIWSLMQLLETFLKLHPTYKIKIFNPKNLETESAKERVFYSAKAQWLIMNLLESLNLPRSEQVIRKRVHTYNQVLTSPENPTQPSDEYPTSVIKILKNQGRWVNRWT